MSDVKSIIRRIQRTLGDPSGRVFSKEEIVEAMNAESQRVLALFPSEVRISTTQQDTEPAYAITSTDLDLTRTKILRVYLERVEAREMTTTDMERITRT